MRWQGRRRSDNIEDRRGQTPGLGMGRGVRLPLRLGKGGGIGTILLILALLYFGIDPSVLLTGGGGLPTGSEQQSSRPRSAAEDQLAEMVSVVLADTEDTWHQLLADQQGGYVEPKLVLFSQVVNSACGMAQSAMGPFYCPADSKVYIDLSFYEDLQRRYGAPGDFAQAYVIAHEVGHHVQHLLGISEQVQSARSRVGETEGNRLSVKLELQADCFAGVWGHHAQRSRKLLEQGDLEEALQAAAAIGDDRLQKQASGQVVPDSFTHGSSAQRVAWFRRGFERGDMRSCNTFDE